MGPFGFVRDRVVLVCKRVCARFAESDTVRAALAHAALCPDPLEAITLAVEAVAQAAFDAGRHFAECYGDAIGEVPSFVSARTLAEFVSGLSADDRDVLKAMVSRKAVRA